jgi:hypothetical protein
MSRLKKFTHSLLSSYALMGVNIVYTLLSVPLALKSLSKAEFGLWALHPPDRWLHPPWSIWA